MGHIHDVIIKNGVPYIAESDMEDLIRKGFSHDKIRKALITIERKMKEKSQTQLKQVLTSDHPPCAQCGGIYFLRTGTCHVCQTCGSSQGCS